ncbi:MAG: hypothetical protein H0T89_22335 [Deltaproteobacteria bacterium]|nr:hypothetical protein [Deltaproteobacteria bacterium]MDQ3300677.1 hypothetical protein [Myxococcota bacterium]
MFRRTAIALLIVLAGCAHRPAPADRSARALFRDLERQVTVAAATGWGVDRIEIEGILEGTLDSVCRVEPLARRELRAWIEGELRRRGAPVEAAWQARGKDLDKVSDLLVLTRVSKLLARAEEASPECPFWLEPEVPFRGRQISERRWQLSFGGGGKGIVVTRGDRTDISAGGAGRLLLGRTFANGDGLYVGAEFGGSAAFPKDAMGERTSIVIGADFVTPVVYRRTLTNAYLEVEAGWLGHSTEADWGDLDHGIHVGFAVGGRTLRTRFLFPGVALGVSWERTFLDGDDITALKIGARVAFDLDL